ncbi:MAG: ELM1/GtrOC1 family putative glycosyltransferase, partial [Limibacillus sp.]
VPSGNGRVVFSGLTAGKYTLSVRAEGYLPVTQDVEIPSGYLRSTVNVNISLRPRPEASGAPPNHLARALILCGRLPDSIKVLNRALELQPPVDHARFLLAHVRYQLGDIQGAFKEMEAYLRTKPPKADELKQQLPHGALLYDWNDTSAENPYRGLLGLADRFVVTGDSIAMLSEACATGRPVQIFDLGGMRQGEAAERDFRVGAFLYAGLMRWGWQPLSRDITLVHRQLLDSGRVTWLGEEPVGSPPDAGQSDMQRAVAAVRQLLGQA